MAIGAHWRVNNGSGGEQTRPANTRVCFRTCPSYTRTATGSANVSWVFTFVSPPPLGSAHPRSQSHVPAAMTFAASCVSRCRSVSSSHSLSRSAGVSCQCRTVMPNVLALRRKADSAAVEALFDTAAAAAARRSCRTSFLHHVVASHELGSYSEPQPSAASSSSSSTAPSPASAERKTQGVVGLVAHAHTRQRTRDSSAVVAAAVATLQFKRPPMFPPGRSVREHIRKIGSW